MCSSYHNVIARGYLLKLMSSFQEYVKTALDTSLKLTNIVDVYTVLPVFWIWMDYNDAALPEHII